MEKLRIINAGPFQDFTLEFQAPVTVVAGSNGCGKTTLLMAASSTHNPLHPTSSGLHAPIFQIQRPEGKQYRDEHGSNRRKPPPVLEMTYTVEGEASAPTTHLTARMDLSRKDNPTSRPMRPPM